MNPIIRQGRRVALWLWLLGISVGLGAIVPSVWAEAPTPTPTPAPVGDTEGGAPGSLPVPWEALGTDSGFTLVGPVAETTLYLPIAAGARPVALEGQLVLAPDVVGGLLEVYVHDALLWATRLQPSVEPRAVRIPLPPDSHPPAAAYLPVTFRVRLQSDDPDMMCNPRPVGMWMQWQQGRLWLEAAATPTSIADFFRKGALQWVLVLPDALTSDLVATALQWLTLLRPLQGAGVEFHILPESRVAAWAEQQTTPAFLRRFVHLRHAETPQTALLPEAPEGPTLVIQGQSADLAAWTSMLERRWQQALPVQHLGPLTFQAPEEVGARRLPLRLWGRPMTVAGYGRLTLTFPFTQADLGAEVHTLGARLVGRYTPLPAGYVAVLSIWFNDALVQSLPLGAEGALDLFIKFPTRRLARENVLQVVVEYTTPEFCVQSIPFQLWLDPESFLWFEEGPTAGLSGFQRFPQALYPSLVVVLEPLTWEHVWAAAHLLDNMQRTTWRPLRLTVADPATARQDERPLLVITQNGSDWHIPMTVQPLRLESPDGGRLQTLVREPTALLFPYQKEYRLGLFLVAQNPQQAYQLTVHLQQQFAGWFGLTGQALVYADPGRLAELPISPGPVATRLAPSLAEVWHQYRLGILLLFSGLIAVGLARLYRRWVRSRPEVPGLAASLPESETKPPANHPAEEE